MQLGPFTQAHPSPHPSPQPARGERDARGRERRERCRREGSVQLGPLTQVHPSTRPGTHPGISLPAAAPPQPLHSPLHSSRYIPLQPLRGSAPQPLLLTPSTRSPKGLPPQPLHSPLHSHPPLTPSTHSPRYVSPKPLHSPLHSPPPLTHPGISLRSLSTATCSPSVLMSAMKRLAPNCAMSCALHKPIPRADPESMKQ